MCRRRRSVAEMLSPILKRCCFFQASGSLPGLAEVRCKDRAFNHRPLEEASRKRPLGALPARGTLQTGNGELKLLGCVECSLSLSLSCCRKDLRSLWPRLPVHGALYSVHFVVFRSVRWVWEALRSLPIGSGSTEYSSQFPLRHNGAEKIMNYFPRLANWTVGENKKLNFYVCCCRCS